jgi:opacity protein-like surface antigen
MSRTAAALVVLGLAAALPGSASAGGLDLRVGAFLPSADSNLFDDDADLYIVNGERITDGKWRGFTGGAEVQVSLSREVELGFHIDGYGRKLHTAYREFEGPGGRDVQQTLDLTVVPMGITLRVAPGGRHATVVPFAGVGADLIYWKYEEFGEFIDFVDPSLPIINDSFRSDGVKPGFHVSGGLRFALSHDFSLVGEARYQFAKADMGDDFRGNKVDLGGLSATLGLHIRF